MYEHIMCKVATGYAYRYTYGSWKLTKVNMNCVQYICIIHTSHSIIVGFLCVCVYSINVHFCQSFFFVSNLLWVNVVALNATYRSADLKIKLTINTSPHTIQKNKK